MTKQSWTSGYRIDIPLVTLFTLHIVSAIFGCFSAFRYFSNPDLQNIIFPAESLFFSRLFVAIFAISTLILLSYCSRFVSLFTDILVAVYSFFGVSSLFFTYKYCNISVISLLVSIFVYVLSLIIICYFSSVSQKNAIANLIIAIKSINKYKTSKVITKIFILIITYALPYVFLIVLYTAILA